MKRTILHCDANNFYASVAAYFRPELRGKPIAVSGNPDKRHGIILAKSEQAKKFGVKTGETIWQAKLKCPDIILVPPQYDEYVRFSDKIFGIYSEYTDRVESFGIDECWLDCTESTNLFGDGRKIADTIRERVKNEVGVSVSVGVSFTKIFAKLGSDMKKPDATTVIDEDNYKEMVWKLPVSDLLMVGRRTGEFLNRLNINTIGDLANFDEGILTKHLGVNGKKLINYANGIETEEVRHSYDKHIPESVSNGTTLPHDISETGEITAVITGLCDIVATRLRKYRLAAKGVSLYLKYNNLHSIGKQIAIPFPISSAKDIAAECIKLLNILYKCGKDLPLRAITVCAYKLEHEEKEHQINMFEKSLQKNAALEKSIDALRAKYGFNIVKSGIVAAHKDLCQDLVETDFRPFKK